MRILPQNTTPRWVIFVIDLIGVCFAFLLAYLLRFEFHPPAEEWSRGLFFLPYWLSGCAIAFLLGKTYQGIIRYTSAQDSLRLFATLSFSVFLLFIWSVSRKYWSEDGLYGVPVSILMIAYLLSLFALFVFRAELAHAVKLKCGSSLLWKVWSLHPKFQMRLSRRSVERCKSCDFSTV